MTSRRGFRIALTLLAACVLSLSACNKPRTNESPPEPGDVAVARIDGDTIWTSDVRNEAIAQGAIGPGEPLDITSDLFTRTLEEVIDKSLLAKAAKAKGLDRSITAQRRLQAQTDQILGDMLIENTIDRHVDEKAVKEQYDEQVKLSKTSEEIRTRVILLKTRADAETVMKEVLAGGSFEAMAMQRSIDQATRYNSGDMGYFTTDVMPQAYKGILATAKTGDTVGPVETDGGWAILRVVDRRPEQLPTLEEERPVITRYLIYNQVAGLLKGLRDEAKIEFLIPKTALGDKAGQEPANAPMQPADDASASGDDQATSASAMPAAANAASGKGKPVALSKPLGEVKGGSSQLVATSRKDAVPAGFHGLAPAAAHGG